MPVEPDARSGTSYDLGDAVVRGPNTPDSREADTRIGTTLERTACGRLRQVKVDEFIAPNTDFFDRINFDELTEL